jgi:hypothetical protein
MLSHTNIIKEEESKDDTSFQTASKRSPISKRNNQNVKQQMLRKLPSPTYGRSGQDSDHLGEIREHQPIDSQEVSQIAASKTAPGVEDQNNTTYFLKKMYDDNNRPELKHLIEQYGQFGESHLEVCTITI